MLVKPTDLPKIYVIHFLINENVADFDHLMKSLGKTFNKRNISLKAKQDVLELKNT